MKYQRIKKGIFRNKNFIRNQPGNNRKFAYKCYTNCIRFIINGVNLKFLRMNFNGNNVYTVHVHPRITQKGIGQIEKLYQNIYTTWALVLASRSVSYLVGEVRL